MKKKIFLLFALIMLIGFVDGIYASSLKFHYGSLIRQFQITSHFSGGPNDEGNTDTYPQLAPSLYNPSASGEYNDSTGLLTLDFNFTDPQTELLLFRNYNKVETENYAVNPGDVAILDLSNYADGEFMVRLVRHTLNDTIYGVFSTMPGMLPVNHSFYYKRTITPQSGNSERPGFSYHASIDHHVNKTFWVKQTVAKQPRLRLTVESEDAEFYAYLFNVDDLSSSNYSFSSVPSGTRHRISTFVNIDKKGDYVLLITTRNDTITGHCNIQFGNYSYTNQAISRTFLPYGSEGINTAYSYIATGNDPQLYVLSGNAPGSVIAYNDDYQGKSTYNWDTTARITQQFPSTTSGVLVTISSLNGGSSNIFAHVQPVVYSMDSGNQLNYLITDSLTCFDDALVAHVGDDGCKYNSFNWSVGEWQLNDNTETKFSQYKDLEAFYAAHGYFPSDSTTSSIDVYGRNGKYENAAVKAFWAPHATGYSMELKVGKRDQYRYFIPRGALNGFYGSPVAYFSRNIPLIDVDITDTLTFMFDPVFENAQLTNNERNDIHNLAMGVDADDYYDFLDLYYDAREVLDNALDAGFAELEASTEYQDLLSFCEEVPDLIYYTMLGVDDGKLLDIKLLNDLVPETPDAANGLAEMNQYNNDNKLNSQGQPIRRSLQTNAILFIKSYLQQTNFNPAHAPKKFTPEGITYSNDESAFVANVNGRTVQVAFELSDEANVTVNVATPYGQIVGNGLRNCHLGSGHHEVTVNVAQPGIYVVAYIANGRIYERKLTIQ